MPSSHRTPVPPVDLPSDTALAGDLWVALDGQTGQLDRANGHTADVLEIVTACEARDAQALKRLQPPWWKRILGQS